MSDKTVSYEAEWEATMVAVAAWYRGLPNGAKAELRRCRTLSDVELHPEFHRLRRELPGDMPIHEGQLPLLVGLSAHLRVRGSEGSAAVVSSSLAAQLARVVGDKPALSETRFRRLMADTDGDALYGSMVQVLRVLNGNVSLAVLWKGLAWWNTQARRTWAYAYYKNN